MWSAQRQVSLFSGISAGENRQSTTGIKKVFVPSTDNSDDGLVYYYVNLPTNKAAEYYRDYFGADSDKLNRYTKFYTDSIKVNEASKHLILPAITASTMAAI